MRAVVWKQTPSGLTWVLLLASACARPNPAFEDSAGASTTASSGTSAGTTSVGTTSVGEGSASSATAASSTSGSDTSGEGDSESEGGSTTGELTECTLPTENECNLYGDAPLCPNKEESCVPWGPDVDGPVVTTYCFPYGTGALGEDCTAGCVGDPGKMCDEGLVCDIREGELSGSCRIPCSGTHEGPNCDQGLCYQFEPDGWQYGICRGDCNPTGPQPCEGTALCAISTAARAPQCTNERDPGELGDDCEARACNEGLICVETGPNNACKSERCCADLCDPPDGVCPRGDTCIQVPDVFGLVDVGYCPQ